MSDPVTLDKPISFKVPNVQTGDSIVFLRDGQSPVPAQVLKRTGDVVDLSTHNGLNVHYGVRHDDDPALEIYRDQRAENGSWRISPQVEKLQAIEETLLNFKIDIQSVRESATTINRVKQIDADLYNAKTAVADLSPRVAALETKLSAIEKQIKNLR